jgi:hypothetical protein
MGKIEELLILAVILARKTGPPLLSPHACMIREGFGLRGNLGDDVDKNNY